MYQSSKKNDFDKINEYLEQVQAKNNAEHLVNTKALMDIGVATIPRRDHVFANEVDEIRALAKLHARQAMEATKATWARQDGAARVSPPSYGSAPSYSTSKQSPDDLLREKVYREWVANKNAQSNNASNRNNDIRQNVRPSNFDANQVSSDEMTREMQKLEKMTNDFQKAVDTKIKDDDKNNESAREIERLKKELAEIKNKDKQQQEVVPAQQVQQSPQASEANDTSALQHMASSVKSGFSDVSFFARNMKLFADDLRRALAKEPNGFKTYSEINNSVGFLQRQIFDFETLDRDLQANLDDVKKSQLILDQMIAKANDARQTQNSIQSFLSDNNIFVTNGGIAKSNNNNQQSSDARQEPRLDPTMQQAKQEIAKKQAELELAKKQAELELAKQQAELLKEKQALQQQMKKNVSTSMGDSLKYNNTQNAKENSTMPSEAINKNNSTAMMLVTSFYQLVPPITSRFITTKNSIERLVKNDFSGAKMDGVSFVARSSAVLIRTLEEDLNRIDKDFFAFQDHVTNNILITKEAIDNFRNIVLGLQSKLDNIIEIENVLNDAARETREISIKHHERAPRPREVENRYNDDYDYFNQERFVPVEKVEQTKIVKLDGDITFSRDISISKAKEQKAINEIINQINFYIEDYKVLKADIMNLHEEFQDYADNVVRNNEITQEVVDTEEKITHKFSQVEKMSHNFNLEVNNLTWKIENNSGEKFSIDSLKSLDSTLFDLKEHFNSLKHDVKRAMESQRNLREKGRVNSSFAQEMPISDFSNTVNQAAFNQQQSQQFLNQQQQIHQPEVTVEPEKEENDEEEREKEAERLDVESKKGVLIEHQKLIKMLVTGFEDHKTNFEFLQRQQAQDALFSLELSNLQQEINNDFSSSKIDIAETERAFDFSVDLDSFELKARIAKITNIFETLQKKLTLLDKKILLFEEMLSHEKINKVHEQTKTISLNNNGNQEVSSTSNK